MAQYPVQVPPCLRKEIFKDGDIIPILHQIWVRMQSEPIHDNLPKYAAELLGAMCESPDVVTYLTTMMSALRPDRDCRLECVNAVKKIIAQNTLDAEEKEECDIRPFAAKGINTWGVLDSHVKLSIEKKWGILNKTRITYGEAFGYVLSNGHIVLDTLQYTHLPSGYFLRGLFPPKTLVALGANRAQGIVTDIHANAQMYDYAGRFEFVVPNEMTELTGLTKQGKTSWRTNSNTTKERRYIVVEFDFPDIPNAHALARSAVLALQLFDCIKPCMIVYSGNKSIHCWFSVKKLDLQTQRRFFKLAIELDADPSTWTRCQLVRMPNGLRDNGKGGMQHVLYWDRDNI